MVVLSNRSWKNLPDAILCAWQAGQEGGNSVADVLKGNASPSGKLTMTFPLSFADAASSKNFPVDMNASIDLVNKGERKHDVKNVDYTNYEEDIYVGYKYFRQLRQECILSFRLWSFVYNIRIYKSGNRYVLTIWNIYGYCKCEEYR